MRKHWAEGMSAEEVERRRARAREWRRQNRARHEANVKAYRKRHPLRHAARQAVYYALKRGMLTRQPCEICGATDVQAHHDDHSRKLDVRWLCRGHHAERDVELRRVGEAGS